MPENGAEGWRVGGSVSVAPPGRFLFFIFYFNLSLMSAVTVLLGHSGESGSSCAETQARKNKHGSRVCADQRVCLPSADQLGLRRGVGH